MTSESLNIGAAQKLISENKLHEAEVILTKIVSDNPDDVEATFFMVKIHYLRKHYRLAEELLKALVKKNSNNFYLLSTLALIQKENDNLEDAESSYRAALEINPLDAETNYNFGILLFEKKEYAQAQNCFEKAVEIKADFPEALYNLGNLHKQYSEYEKARGYYKRSIEADPQNDKAYYNLGVVSEKIFYFDEAEKYYDQAIAINNENVEAHWNKALLLLANGNYSAGWKEYSWRLRKKEFLRKDIKIKRWQGEELRGRRIFAYWEQGFGDCVQFIRYLKKLKDSGAVIILEVKKRIYELLKEIDFIDEFVIKDEPYTMKADYSIPLLSIPAILQIDPGKTETGEKYLSVQSKQVDKYKKMIDPGNLNIGIIWQGSPDNISDAQRSMHFSDFLPLLKNPGTSFYSLQFGEKDDVTLKLFDEYKVTDLPLPFHETAAAIEALDLIITVDTVTAHIAGALGKPVWNLLSYSPDWRWGREKSSTHWYNSMKLYRQSEPGNWTNVINEIEIELSKLQAQKKNSGNPETFKKLFNLGIEASENANFVEADNLFEQASKHNPNHLLVYYNWGLVKYNLGQKENAVKLFRKCLEVDPQYLQAVNDLSFVLIEKGVPEEAISVLEEYSSTGNENTFFNLGLAYRHLEKFEESIKCFVNALGLNHYYQEANINLASSYFLTGKIFESLRTYFNMLKLGYSEPEVYLNIAICFHELTLCEEAEKYFKLALDQDKDYSEAHYAYSEVLLLQEKFRSGLEEYEWRLKLKDHINYFPEVPVYKGEKLSGKIIIVLSEQGYGDNLNFIRYCRNLKEAGAYVVFQCDKNLNKLFEQQEYIDKIIHPGDECTCDYKIDLISLVKFYVEKTTQIDGAKYLQINEQAAELPGTKGQEKVGLVWRGKNFPIHNRKRHIKLEKFGTLVANDKFDFFSLQLEPSDDEITFMSQYKINNVAGDIKDFSDTAKILSGLDYLITIDTSIAHLAGALGVKTFLLLPAVPDWRWFLHTDHSPWYNSVKVLRQITPGDWDSMIVQLENHLMGKQESEHDSLDSNEINELLNGMGKLIRNKNYEKVLEASNVLLNKGFLNERILNIAGTAAAGINNSETALFYFTKAQNLSVNENSYSNIAILLFKAGLFNESLTYYKKALEINPKNAETLYNFGIALFELGNFNKASEIFNKAIQIEPDNFRVKYNLGLIDLIFGNYARGFEYYELRRKVFPHRNRELDKPLWQGEPSTGKTIFVYCDQGFGDLIQFSRYLPMVKKTGCKIIFETKKELKRIFDNASCVDEIIVQKENGISPTGYDMQAPLLSLPYILKADVNSVPRPLNIFEEADAREISGSGDKIKIGIFWRGSATNLDLKYRSCNPQLLFDSVTAENVELYSLQLDTDETEKKIMQSRGVVDLTENITDFYDTAGWIKSLDLIITIDSAVAHLAGSMNKAVWVMLPYVADWRWMTEREDSIWYSSMKLFRQESKDDWNSVFKKVKRELKKYIVGKI